MGDVCCYLCQSDKVRVLYQSDAALIQPEDYLISESSLLKPEALLKCGDCGFVFAKQSAVPYEELYQQTEDQAYLAESVGRRKAARKVLKRIKKHKRSGKLLEVGCSAGFFLDEARQAGFDVTGIELSEWAMNFAKNKLGLTDLYSSVEEGNFPDHCFDVIVMQDVIEHLVDPAGMLLKLRKLIKNNGILYISTPNIASRAAKLFKMRWWGINAFHLFYFSKKTLSQLLMNLGYQPGKCYTYTRYFSLDYLSERVKSYSSRMGRFLHWLFDKTSLSKFCFPVNFYDQLDMIVTKKRMLSDFDDTKIQRAAQVLNKDAKVVVVLPAYNAAKTLPITIRDIPKDVVDHIILVDDCSPDNTVAVAKSLNLEVIEHKKNRGYGGNQKTCYQAALEYGADIVVMVHPDYQYDPTVIPEMIKPIQYGEADACFGSRMMKGGALEGGMPKWKHNANILLTAAENVVLGVYLTEYHTGFRAYSADLLRSINFEANSDGFVFDTEIIVQAILKGAKIEEVPIRTRYFDEASKIRFWPSSKYGLGILWTLGKYLLQTKTPLKFKQFR